MSQSLFTFQTPTQPDQFDGGTPGITTATTLVFARAGFVSGIRFFATLNRGLTETYTAELWQVTNNLVGTRLAFKQVPGSAITVGTWNVIMFDAPVAVSNSVAYRAALNNNNPGGGRYVAAGSFFSFGPLVNGDITGIQGGSTVFGNALSNGVFALNSAPATYPTDQFGQACYFVDVLFDLPSTDQGAFLPFFG